jgi:hypothetical protein
MEESPLEGPYWDFSQRLNRCNEEVQLFAQIIADHFVAGDLEGAALFTDPYRSALADKQACRERYALVKDNPVVRWVGYR